MKKLEVGTKVNVEVNNEVAGKLGISESYSGNGVVHGTYPLGHYIQVVSNDKRNGRIMAIADKYNAIKPAG